MTRPVGLRIALLDPCDPGKEPAQEDSLGPGLSPVGSAAQRPNPAADKPPTAHPSSLETCLDLKPEDVFFTLVAQTSCWNVYI